MASAGYFMLLDFARPALEQRRLVAVWWLILALYAVLVFAFGFARVIGTRPKLSGTGFLLWLGTLFLYDPTINVYLKAVGLGWLWIAFLIVGFLWLLTLMKITFKDQQRASRLIR